MSRATKPQYLDTLQQTPAGVTPASKAPASALNVRVGATYSLEDLERRFDASILPHLLAAVAKPTLTDAQRLTELKRSLTVYQERAAKAAASLAHVRATAPDGCMVDGYAGQLAHHQRAVAEVEAEIAELTGEQKLAAAE